MATSGPRVDACIAKSAAFAQPILRHLRALLHAHCPNCTETIKWGVPHFDYRGGIFCQMAEGKSRNWKYEKC